MNARLSLLAILMIIAATTSVTQTNKLVEMRKSDGSFSRTFIVGTIELVISIIFAGLNFFGFKLGITWAFVSGTYLFILWIIKLIFQVKLFSKGLSFDQLYIPITASLAELIFIIALTLTLVR